MADQRKKRKTSAVHVLETFVAMLMDDSLLVIQNNTERDIERTDSAMAREKEEKDKYHTCPTTSIDLQPLGEKSSDTPVKL